jgi:hypothetical protein
LATRAQALECAATIPIKPLSPQVPSDEREHANFVNIPHWLGAGKLFSVLLHRVQWPEVGKEVNPMEIHSNPAPQGESKPHWLGIWKFVFVAIFFILLFLLGQSMVQHRFFAGERVHHNGSIGQ